LLSYAYPSFSSSSHDFSGFIIFICFTEWNFHFSLLFLLSSEALTDFPPMQCKTVTVNLFALTLMLPTTIQSNIWIHFLVECKAEVRANNTYLRTADFVLPCRRMHSASDSAPNRKQRPLGRQLQQRPGIQLPPEQRLLESGSLQMGMMMPDPTRGWMQSGCHWTDKL